MKYGDFLSHLEKNSERELVFKFNEKDIKRNYHITEVLKSSIESIDCGGKVDQWEETILQLIEPKKTEEERYMPAAKAKRILDKSAKLINYGLESDLILEFRPMGSTAAQRFKVSSVWAEANKLIIGSQGLETQCKAGLRKSDETTQACCESVDNSTASRCCA